MRFASFVLFAATTTVVMACDQPQDPATRLPNDTAAVTTSWEKVDLAPNASASVFAINDSGMIVGLIGDSAQPRNGPSHPFVYHNGILRRLVTETFATPGAISPTGEMVGVASNTVVVVWDSVGAPPRTLDAEPVGDDANLRVVSVNEHGDILAFQVEHDGISGHAKTLLWHDGVRRNLGFLADSGLGHPSTFATAMNGSGQIVGQSKVALVVHTNAPPGERFHPFIWENGVMRDLGVLGHIPCTDVAEPMDCATGEATDINAHGVVVGYTTGPGGVLRAFVWENGVMRDLGVFPGQSTQALAINDRGQILGIADTVTFLWENGAAQVITGPQHEGGGLLSGDGRVVGTIRLNDHLLHTFVWEAGQFTDLGEGMPIAVNSRGDIIGTWYHQDGGYQAILWRKKRS
jgi:probable HAF family extracellular repeat protein